jgi:glycosyltransferase involved in cell wall biosynthesis
VTGSIAINGRFLTRKAAGVDRFARELLGAWLTTRESSDIVKILVPQIPDAGYNNSADFNVRAVGFNNGHLWEQLELPLYCRDDLLLNFCNSAPLLKARQLAVIHDASVMANPTQFSRAYRIWHSLLCKGLMRNASVVATVSKFSASELMRYFGTRSRGVEIIYESGEHILRASPEASILDKLKLRNQRYVLAVGSQTLNKNFQGVMQAAQLLKDLNVKIVAAGGSNNRVFSGWPLKDESLILAGYVSDGELRVLYENAECFVFPSFYEGFGLPPLEAMHCGCPTLVSERTAIPEICGEASAYCDPSDSTDIARQLRRILESASLRDEMRIAGLARTKLFTWRRAANQLEQLLAADR